MRDDRGMGSVRATITTSVRQFIDAQHVFFVGTAPLDADGHVNVSPKGHGTLRVVDERTVAYLDLTGSGVETIAHVRENGRITLMWCAFDGPPRIVRLYGRGRPDPAARRGRPARGAPAVRDRRPAARSVFCPAPSGRASGSRP